MVFSKKKNCFYKCFFMRRKKISILNEFFYNQVKLKQHLVIPPIISRTINSLKSFPSFWSSYSSTILSRDPEKTSFFSGIPSS